VVVDIAVDQGGCIETIHPTAHNKPIYMVGGVVHYAVPNMPALVARTSTIALTQATEPYIVALAKQGIEPALASNAALALGVNTRDGDILNAAVANAMRKPANC
jgi:alanine dehydrogenase